MPIQSRFSDIDIPKCNVLSFLFPNGDAGDEPLWINADDPNKYVSAAGALSLIKRFALGLKDRGVPSQSAVMVVSPNHIYVPIVYLAAAGSGRIFTGANPAYTVDEFFHQMKMMQPAVLLVHPSVMKKCLEAAKKAGIDQKNVFEFSDGDPESSDIPHWTKLLGDEKNAQQWAWDELKGDKSKTIAVVNFSSGTTGLPKGVCISHHNMVANALQIIHSRFNNKLPPEGSGRKDRWLVFLPWFHAYAQWFAIVVTCKRRSPVYAMSQFDFGRYIKHIDEFGITTLQVVPPIVVMFAKRKETENARLSSVNYIMSAAAPLKRDIQNAVSKKLGAPIMQSWGMTETSCTGLYVPGFEQDETGSVGCLLPNTEAMLVDLDEKEIQDDSEGELWVRGPQMMLKYLNNEEATQETLTKDGWLKTGDVAKYEDGKFWIVDRRKELIKVKGLQVAPAELEAVVLDHDDVLDAAVVGITVQEQEHPRAYVALSDNAKGKEDEAFKSIAQHVADRVAKHKQLTGGVVSVKGVPRLPSGKIQRNIVKNWAAEDAKRMESEGKAKL